MLLCLNKRFSIFIAVLLISLFLKHFASAQNVEERAFSSNEPVQAIGHRFGIKSNPVLSKLSYDVQPNELTSGISQSINPNIIIVGSLSVNSLDSASKCMVKLPSSVLKAENENGETIDVFLRGTIGNKSLTTDFIHPEFDAFNEAEFRIEGYIDTRSFKRGLSPGTYNFEKNLNLVVEFNG
ncbi:MAG: hypothetical protein QNJ31_07255 [Candidatus Caenarcaniphilales bacterium]|nr:hypothetical protein [Candidatus Caenarcaniphilales bacterium]